MNKLLWFLLLLSSCIATNGWAQDRMLNISASGLVNGAPVIRLVACTIVTGEITVVIFAEAVAEQTNPLLGVTWLHDGIEEPIDGNDDWVNLTAGERSIITQYLREPHRSTDSAMVLSVANTAICAYAFEEVKGGPQGEINLQITEIAY